MSRLQQSGPSGSQASAPPTVPFVFPIQKIAYVAGTMTADAATYDVFQYNLTGNAGVVGKPTGLVDGMRFMIAISQDATGGRTISAWNAAFNFPQGVPVLSSAARAIDYFACLYRSANSKYTGSAEAIDMLAQSNGF